jgi:hypothetical protein
MHRFIVPAHHVIEKIVLYYELRLNSHQIIIMSISLKDETDYTQNQFRINMGRILNGCIKTCWIVENKR